MNPRSGLSSRHHDTQGHSRSWCNYDFEMSPTYLDAILLSHRARAARDQRDWRARLEETHYDGPSFVLVLRQGSSPFIKVIAEVKRRSPSKGELAPDLDVAALARIYRDAGASAISVLTDREFFEGSLEDLALVRKSVELPVLRKDFTVSENDVLDAAEAGAGAVLLIVAALSDAELTSFLEVADTCGVDALVEVHDEDEARRALGAGARVIGVNQRDLRTFEVDPTRAEGVIASLPRDALTICESGVTSVADVERAAQAGFDAVLVGEAFVTALDTSAIVKAFSLVPSVQRA
jgi:indole-3-glycerol phosphate synthase